MVCGSGANRKRDSGGLTGNVGVNTISVIGLKSLKGHGTTVSPVLPGLKVLPSLSKNEKSGIIVVSPGLRFSKAFLVPGEPPPLFAGVELFPEDGGVYWPWTLIPLPTVLV